MSNMLRRLLALALVALLALPTISLAESDDVLAQPAEAPVLEMDEQPLPGDPPAEDAPSDTPVEIPSEPGTASEPEADEPEDVTTPEIEPAPAQTVEGYEDLVIDNTLVLSDKTWTRVNLIRANGFTGALATIEKSLTLEDVLIEGVPARTLSLGEWFDLAPGATVRCAEVAPLQLSLSAFSFNKGASLTLSAAVNGVAVAAKSVKWSSSNKKVTSVSSRGVVKAKKKGTAIISAKYNGETAICSVVVTNIVLPRKVKLESKAVTLGLYGTKRLKAVITPEDADNVVLSWKSSDPAVVSVDAEGNISGIADGTAKVTVTTINGKSASCQVTVREIKPTGVDFRKLYVTMHPGETFQAETVTNPVDATNRAVSFASDNEAVAAVDAATGEITALSCGSATITATCAADASISNTCKVCVIEPDAPQLAGLIIGINPGHQITTIKASLPLAPGSTRTAKSVKTGASGHSTGQHEYEVVLQIGLKLKRILEEHGATVVITRTTNDVMLTNIDRAQMLNAAGCDVALQLHNNSCSSSSRTGVSGYIRTTGDWVEESRTLSACICEGMSACTGFKNLGVKIYNDYMSLNWTTTPSVLLEMGYLSNSSDDKKLALDETREQLAQGIYQGLCAYFGR